MGAAIASRESALNAISVLREQYTGAASDLHDANEATTRLLIINQVLNALGWQDKEFNPESPTGKGYIDYLLTVDNIPRIIVEAKRIGHTFRSPSFRMQEYEYSLSYLRRAFKQPMTDVLDQATNYAYEKEVQFAVLTNGAEWMLVQTIPPPGLNIDELKAVYFGNILSKDSNFDLLWELLSKLSVLRGTVEDYFSQLNSIPAADSLVPLTEIGGLHWKKPPAEMHLRDFYHRFFAEMTDSGRRLMLEKCFVTDTRVNQYQGELRRALKDTAPAFLPQDTLEFTPADYKEVWPEESGDQAGRVILITGSVGCGKSTFITKVTVEAKQEHQQNLIVLKLDLINEINTEPSTISSDLWRFVSDEWKSIETASYTYETLKRVFGRELAELRDGPFSKIFEKDAEEYERKEAEKLDQLTQDPKLFVVRSWRHYRQRRYGLALVLDNVDRASEEFQEQVYAFAHELAHSTGATVIVTMRESTFYRGQASGFLDVRSTDTVIHLQTPNLEQLLSKRIKYIENYLDEDHRISKWRTSSSWPDFRESAQLHAQMLKQIFLIDPDGREVLGLLAAVAWHNVRYFLELLRQVHSQLGSSDGVWQKREIIAALMTSIEGDSQHSILTNVFSPPFPNYHCYFLKIRILLLLAHSRKKSGERGLTSQRLITFARLYGYQTRWTRNAIEEMVRERLLDCLEIPATADFTQNYRLSEHHSFRISPSAITLLENIVHQPIYLALIGNDLPFYSYASFDKYLAVLKNIQETLDDSHLERAAIDMIDSTNLASIVANYLTQMFQSELPPGNFLRSNLEVSETEIKLERLIGSLRSLSGVQAINGRKFNVPFSQRSLFDDTTAPSTSLIDELQIPENITTLRIKNSEQAPLIFWALVALRKEGKYASYGAEISRVINEYLVTDHNRKAPTNISRALRGSTLQDQEWLVTDVEPNTQRRVFRLAENWPEFWEQFFNTPAPQVD